MIINSELTVYYTYLYLDPRKPGQYTYQGVRQRNGGIEGVGN